jgi:hypothetical protein
MSLMLRFMIFTASVRNILDNTTYIQQLGCFLYLYCPHRCVFYNIGGWRIRTQHINCL